MPADVRHKTIMELPGEEAYNEHQINNLIGCMVDLKSQQFEKTINEYIDQRGIEKTLTSIIFGFLEKVGILWQTDRIIPIQEHIVSNIVRQKLIRAIDDLPAVSEGSFYVCPKGSTMRSACSLFFTSFGKSARP
jgi:hypothetical protein